MRFHAAPPTAGRAFPCAEHTYEKQLVAGGLYCYSGGRLLIGRGGGAGMLFNRPATTRNLLRGKERVYAGLDNNEREFST